MHTNTCLPKFALPALCLAVVLSGVNQTRAAAEAARNPQPTVLGIEGTQFTLNGKPAFLLGISYYGALGAPEDFLRRDLDDLQDHGFNWLRVWATWAAFDHNVSAVGALGLPREPFLSKLQCLVAECDRRSLVVDVTLTRSAARLADLESHQRAVEVGAFTTVANAPRRTTNLGGRSTCAGSDCSTNSTTRNGG